MQELASFLKFKRGKHRVKAVRLRDVFSMGVLFSLEKMTKFLLDQDGRFAYSEGSDVAAALGIEKYEEPEPVNMTGTQSAGPRDPGIMPFYEIQNYRKHKRVFPDIGGDVVVTEKIHGCNARYIHDGERLWVGSHRTWKAVGSEDIWTRIAVEHDLEMKLSQFPMVGIYGEVYGDVQDLTYGHEPGSGKLDFRIFDVYEAKPFAVQAKTGEVNYLPPYFLDWDEMEGFARRLHLQTVPTLYVGPFSPEIVEPLRLGESTIAPGQIREGIVIKSRFGGWHRSLGGRAILKLVGEQYLLRSGGSERH